MLAGEPILTIHSDDVSLLVEVDSMQLNIYVPKDQEMLLTAWIE